MVFNHEAFLKKLPCPTGGASAKEVKTGFAILDVMLPGMDGGDIRRELRKVLDVPTLMLTEREEEIDRVPGLSLMAAPFVSLIPLNR
jgi:DNA-binding response OmpR family regulator